MAVKEKSQPLHDTVGLQLPLNSTRSLQPNRTLDARGEVSDFGRTIPLEGNPVKPEKGNGLMKKVYAQQRTRSHISLQSGVVTALTGKSRNQSDADRLNKVMANYFSQEWSTAYEQNELPDTLSDFGEAVKATFGATVVPITPAQDTQHTNNTEEGSDKAATEESP